MRLIIAVTLALLLATQSSARTIAGIEVPENTSLPGYEGSLVLNGAGIRTKMFFKIYLAALYLPTPVAEAKQIVESEAAKRIEMRFIHSEVSKEKMDDGWQDGFSNNTSSAQMSRLADRLDQFKGMFGTMREGDLVWLDYLPGTGTRVTINGVEKGVITGHDFAVALFNVWLGPKPVTDSLKDALLGN